MTLQRTFEGIVPIQGDVRVLAAGKFIGEVGASGVTFAWDEKSR
jgi:uncharacterized protein GlcG (DUF336 family)